MSRYDRHIILDEIGQSGQDKILNAKVLVVGAGGLGCPVLQYLTAAGIGTLGVIDFDTVEESNLQRQILFGTSSLGENKAIAAKNRLADLNPSINLIAYPEALTTKNALALFKQYDIIVDGSDNFATRYLVNDAALITNKPVVYGAIYKFEGQVSVFNFQSGPSYRCLFANPPKGGSVTNCSEVGVLGVLPGIIGTMQANEVLKVILGFEDVLSGKLFCYNAKTAQTYTVKIAKAPEEFNKVVERKNDFVNYDYGAFCEAPVPVIDIVKAARLSEVCFIDVREFGEEPAVSLSNVLQIPLSHLEQNLHQINPSKRYVLFCQTGVRSKKAVNILKDHGIDCQSLIGGAHDVLNHLKPEM